MGSLGKVRIGTKAPEFHCDAVHKGVIEEVTLSDYVSEKKPQWLIMLFIPAAFSFVCPTEVLAFQNCLDEFKDRNCQIVFVSVDTKHALWHWQNVPRQYGGLGHIDIPLLSDVTHKMGRDYGVLIEDQGICLRGMFILDNKGVVQHITINNVSVGRSVLEALRLVEALQAVDKHGVLCPIDWRPARTSSDRMQTLNTISNTLTESYDERLANLQRDFGDTVATDLDAKHGSRTQSSASQSAKPSLQGPMREEAVGSDLEKDYKDGSPTISITLSREDCRPMMTTEALHSCSAPASTSATPVPTPLT